MKTYKEKNEKLEEKVDKLVEELEDKIEELKNEKRLRKRLGYMIKCKKIVAKIQRQQDLLKARKGFEKLKEDNNITVKENKVIARQNIIEINKGIKILEKYLRTNSNYDFNSSKFMFSKEDVENVGGIEQYVDELEESQKLEQIETAKRIRKTEEVKSKLNEFYERLEKQKQYLAEADTELKTKNNRISRREMMVTAKSNNIFTKIGDFTKGVVAGVKEFWTEFKESWSENKQLDEQKINYLNMIQENYEREKATIEQEYEQKRKALEERYDKMEENLENKYKGKERGKAKVRRNRQAAKFQEELQNMAKVGHEESNFSAKEDIDEQKETNLPSEEDIIRQTEENEKNLDKEQNGEQGNIDHEESLKPDTVIISDEEEIDI